MEKRGIIRFSISSFLALICTLGFTIQITDITSRHFNYRTGTLIKLDTPDSILLPSVSSCFQKNPMLNYSQVSSVFNRSGIVHFTDHIDWDEYYRKTSDWTMENWFNFTPKTDHILDWCGFRKSNHYGFYNYSPKDCFKYSKMTKYFDREYVCYEYEPEFGNKTVGMIQSTMTPGYNGIMYRISFNTKLVERYEYVSVSVHSHDSSFFYDTVYGSTHKVQGYRSHFKFDVYYQEVEQKRMRIPYDTQCVDIPNNIKSGIEYQLEDLNNKSKKILNKVIPFLPTYELSQHSLFNDLDMRNETLMKMLQNLVQKDRKLKECKTKYFISRATSYDYYIFRVVVHWPQDEKISVIYFAQLDMIDLIIFVGSCTGMWFGISVISLIDVVLFIARKLDRKFTDDSKFQGQKMYASKKEHFKKMENDIKLLKHQLNLIRNFRE